MTSDLADLGIGLRDRRPGEHRCPCPHCATMKPRKGDDALAVRTEPDGSATWLCHRCGWRGGAKPSRIAAARPPTPARQEQVRPTGDLDAALDVWRVGKAVSRDTVTGAYLRARGCPLPPPGAHLRCLELHRHPSGYAGPCMLGLITNPSSGRPMSLHRTWVTPDGAKADVERPRLLWPGLPSRGVIRLCEDAEVTLGIAVAEGIETCLAASLAFGRPVWACLSAGALAELPVLQGIEGLTIIADADRPDRRGRRAGEAAAIACARRWRDAGIEARIWLPDGEGIDFADLAQDMAA